MFDGIVLFTGNIIQILKYSEEELTLMIKPKIEELKLGSSICCAGVCLTVTEIDCDSFCVYVSRETYNKTTLKYINEGDYINLCRAMIIGGTLDGHFVQGHVDDTLKILDIQKVGESHQMKFEMRSHLKKYITYKGSITIDGVSLTVNNVETDCFYVNVIPHTFYNTTFQYNKIGDYVNVEVDILARYIENLMNK